MRHPPLDLKALAKPRSWTYYFEWR